ncbi:MAG: ABC transporter substrate-binding protein [Phycisphaeraceae bacterium]|nr:ABC transporter substrate-binding protein [Phycisphaeraceae bacterium]MCB9848017.1 ABC transporter substrate-binding protein [Phycisphaeraceae bacterium]
MPGENPTLTIGHSPDPDDAFMWWPLDGAIDTGRFRFRAVPEDIESLNRRAAESGDLDITAISMHTYARVRDRYALTSCGASVGDGFGPKIVARRPHDRAWLASPGLTIAIPGERTTAYLAARLCIGRAFDFVAMPFERIMDAVAGGEADAGVVIHEGQLTYGESGLTLIADLGAWWKERTGLPLPLGANAIRRDLDARFGAGTMREVTGILSRSIEHALAHRAEGVAYARGFARGLPEATTDEFISMYVNERTIDLGATGAEAVGRLLRDGASAGLCPDPGEIDLVFPLSGTETRQTAGKS